jgi:PTS system nitrogen regulatory IIA component
MPNDILTLEEVAEYLRVSERTVYDWAQKGEIPAGKLGNTWRFKRNEIERWVDRKLSGGRPLKDSHTIDMTHLLAPERVLFLKSNSKNDVLLELIYSFSDSPQIKDINALKEAIFRREELMSTGIGQGIAIPHVRIPSARDLVIAVGISRKGIEDYASLDGLPVHIILMLAAAEDQHAYYLKALAALSTRLQEPGIKEMVLGADLPDRVYKIVTGGAEE